jgi:REP element-mobilizing transposase RayT
MMEKRRKSAEPGQACLPFRPGRGGVRPGAGRKAVGARAGVSHRARAKLAARHPVHVTVKVREGLPPLRSKGAYAALRAAFAAGCNRFGFRLAQYSVQRDHIHMIVEAKDRRALARGVQGLLIRVAKGLNRFWGRSGSVFGDRYHDQALRTPKEVRNALSYVLNNARKHGLRLAQAVDLFSSACWFDGWRERFRTRGLPAANPVATARTWLLTVGWRRHGLICPDAVPGNLSPG